MQVVQTTAESYLGCQESDGSHEAIIDLYNAHEPLAQNYTVQYTDSWCAAFVIAVSIRCGLTDIIPTECSCERLIGLFGELGRWQEDDNYTPLPGDIIFYDWDEKRLGDCRLGRPCGNRGRDKVAVRKGHRGQPGRRRHLPRYSPGRNSHPGLRPSGLCRSGGKHPVSIYWVVVKQ